MVDFLPFFHIYGMAVLLLPGLAARRDADHDAARSTLDRFLEIVEEYQATNLFMVPPALLALANSDGDRDLAERPLHHVGRRAAAPRRRPPRSPSAST